jgi:prepilin-type N-terminal cleavage/methylation domain-containing protein
VSTTGSARERLGDDAGLTLIEMMVSMFLLAIILAAAAGSLISFSRASADNERRVQATAMTTRLHEELQSRPWVDAVLFEDELASLSSIGVDASAGSFEGQDLVTIEGSGCAVGDDDCRGEVIPRASQTITVDGRDYEVLRVISWIEPEGAAAEEVKRFTTVVRWESLGRTLEERLDSTRAPTPGEDPAVTPPGVQFIVAPQEVALTETGRNVDPISFDVDFEGLGVITGAKVLFRHAGLASTVPPAELALTRDGTSQRFTGLLPAEAHTWSAGALTFQVVGNPGVNQISASAAVTFVLPEDASTNPGQPVVTQVTALPGSTVVGRHSNTFPRLCNEVVVEARVDGLGTGATVTASYKPDSSSSVTMSPVSTPISSSSALFRATFPRHSNSPWTPSAGAPETEVFLVVATHEGRSSVARASNQISFTRSTKNNSNC